jgi:hypothetical protein
MTAGEIAQAGRDNVSEGLALMKGPLGDFSAAAKLVANYEPTALYDETKLGELENRLRKAFPPLLTQGDKGDGANARGSKIAEDMMGGQLAVVADSLAQIGGGGGVAGVNAVLEEARVQTAELKEQTAELKEITKGIIQIGRYNADGKLEIFTVTD